MEFFKVIWVDGPKWNFTGDGTVLMRVGVILVSLRFVYISWVVSIYSQRGVAYEVVRVEAGVYTLAVHCLWYLKSKILVEVRKYLHKVEDYAQPGLC